MFVVGVIVIFSLGVVVEIGRADVRGIIGFGIWGFLGSFDSVFYYCVFKVSDVI